MLIKLQQEHGFFLSVILNSGFWLAAIPATKIQSLDHFNLGLISQLTEGISSVPKKLLRYFNRTIISTSFVTPFPVCPVICCLNLNEILLLLLAGKSITLLLSRANYLYSIAINFLSLNKHHYILLDYT